MAKADVVVHTQESLGQFKCNDVLVTQRFKMGSTNFKSLRD